MAWSPYFPLLKIQTLLEPTFRPYIGQNMSLFDGDSGFKHANLSRGLFWHITKSTSKYAVLVSDRRINCRV